MTIRRPLTGFVRKALRLLAGDRRGVSAVEFALIAPIMMLLYYGLADVTLAMMAERRASHAASTIGDLVAQETSVASTDVDDIFTIAQSVVYPFPSTTLSMRVTSVTADANATPKVDWSRAKGSALTKYSAGATITTLPANYLAANESTIMAEVKYPYTTPLKKVINRTLNFSAVYYLSPRKSDQVTCATC